MLFEMLQKLIFGKAFIRRSVSQPTEQKIRQEWKRINDALVSKSPAQLRQAVISADKSLDNALRDICVGQSMAERLKEVKDRFDRHTYNRVWEAHKIRNNLVHEAGYEPPYYVLTDAVASLRNGLIVLGVRV